jgi:hypothetical protein
MKSPACPCAKKTKRKSKTKTQTKTKQMIKPTAELSKFAGLRAPILANTSGVFDRPMIASSRGGTFTMPGFSPVNAFPYPGITKGNASQIDGLLPGSGRVDMVAANIYRVQDRMDDVASGLGVTGLNSAPKGNVNARRVNMNAPGPLIQPVKIEGQVSLSDILKRQRLGQIAARFNAYNPDLGDSKENPISLDTKSLPPSSSSANQITQSKKQPIRVAAERGIQRRTGEVFPG